MFATTNTKAEPVSLYRGDSKKIDEFKLNKTNPGCLYGPGIYLTEDIRVAQTYRTKGDWGNGEHKSGSVKAVNKTMAMEKIRDAYIHGNESARRASLLKNGSKDTSRERVRTLLAHEFTEKVAKGDIKVTRTGLPKIVESVEMWEFKYEDTSPSVFGWISSFVFDADELRSNTIEIDAYQLHKDVFEILQDKKHWKDEEHRQEFLKCKSFRPDKQYLHRCLKHSIVIQSLKEYGIEGYRHRGGWVTGGRRHQVYILFSDEYVNAHRVDVFK